MFRDKIMFTVRELAPSYRTGLPILDNTNISQVIVLQHAGAVNRCEKAK